MHGPLNVKQVFHSHVYVGHEYELEYFNYYREFFQNMCGVHSYKNTSSCLMDVRIHIPYEGKGKAIPGEALRVQGFWGSQISRQLAHEGGKVVSLTHRPPLPQEIFLLEAGSTHGVTVAGRNIYHRESNTRPSELERSVSTDWATACPIFLYNNIKICRFRET